MKVCICGSGPRFWSWSWSYLRRSPGLILWASVHGDGFVHVLVHLKEAQKQRLLACRSPIVSNVVLAGSWPHIQSALAPLTDGAHPERLHVSAYARLSGPISKPNPTQTSTKDESRLPDVSLLGGCEGPHVGARLALCSHSGRSRRCRDNTAAGWGWGWGV